MARKSKDQPQIKRRSRVVPRNGRDGFQVVRIGNSRAWFADAYVDLLASKWGYFLFVIAAFYLLSNILFAFAYIYVGGVENARPGSFQDAFFFSVETMATIGYGKMVPVSLGANILMTIESLWGFTFFAIVTGLVYARFSHPTARVLFADRAIIGPLNGEEHLMLRLSNQRTNRIVDASAALVLLCNETTKEGKTMRRFIDLPLRRDHVPLLQLSWTVAHRIDKDSPLYDVGPKELEAMEAEIIISLTGLDETMSQTIHARHSYLSDEIACNSLYVDVLKRRDGGLVEVDYKRFHDIIPAADYRP